jgi:hypothetical protein
VRLPRCVRFAVLSLAVLGVCATACAPDFQRLDHTRSARGSFGAEVYKLLCRRVAGSEIPSDLDGRSSAALCLGDAAAAADALRETRETLPPPLRALAERREEIVAALDVAGPPPLTTELDGVFRSLIPYYGPAHPQVPDATAALAAWLLADLQGTAATSAFARQLRVGMVPIDAVNGILRASLAAPHLSTQLHVLLPLLLTGSAAPGFRALRTALGLDLASSDDLDDAASLERLLGLRDAFQPAAFSLGKALRTAKRDDRGLPLPSRSNGVLTFPFLDTDADGRADLDGDGFTLDPRFQGALPEPFQVPREVAVARDGEGRACALLDVGGSDCSRTLYDYTDDRDGSLLAGLPAVLRRAAEGDDALLARVLAASPAFFGKPASRTATFGAYTLAYEARGGSDEPFLDAVHALTAPEAHSGFDASMAALEHLLGPGREGFADALGPWISMLGRTAPEADAYPDATLADGNVFWDEVLYEAERLARRRAGRRTPSLMEELAFATLGYTRASSAPDAPRVRTLELTKLGHAGTLLALAMRYKDEWRTSPRAVEKRLPGEPALFGAYQQPVDRTLPDAPATCGRDGCGGPIASTAFAAFALPGQRCVVEHDARRGQGDDCGTAGNQSIMQRALGLLAESAGRAQCNRPLAVGDLVDEALGDPCKSLDPEVGCSMDADCAGVLPRSPDHVCDPIDRICVARPGSGRCAELQAARVEERRDLVAAARAAIELDYVCPTDDPEAPCNAFKDQYPAAFVDTDGAGPNDAAIQPCHLLDMKDVGRVFGHALTGEYTFDIPNPWVRRFLEDIARAGPVSETDDTPAVPDCELAYRMVDPRVLPPCIPGAARITRALLDDIPATVDRLGELVEFLVGDDGFFATDADVDAMRPDVRVLARVLFAAGPAEGVQLFDPLLLRGAPRSCVVAPTLPTCAPIGPAEPPGSCCIANSLLPPLQYRLDTFFGSTSFALETPVPFADGSEVSLFDITKPVAAAFNRLDVEPNSAADVEDLDYGLMRVGKLLAEHYDSVDNPALQSRNPVGRWYRRGTGLVLYERLVADLLDGADVRPDAKGPAGTPLVDQARLARDAGLDGYRALLGLLEALRAQGTDAGGSAFDALVHGGALMLNPHVLCAGEGGDDRVLGGKGACDAVTSAAPPLRLRSGEDVPCWNDGRCFDGKALPRHFITPIALLRETVSRLLVHADAQGLAPGTLHALLRRVVDFFFARNGSGALDGQALSVLHLFTTDARKTWAEDRARGALSTKAARDLADVTEAMQGPVASALVTTIAALGQDSAAGQTLSALAADMLDPEGVRALVASLSDLLELSHGERSLAPARRAMGGLFLPNGAALLAGTQSTPDLAHSALEAELGVGQILVASDTRNRLALLGRNLAAKTLPGGKLTPLDVLSEALLAVHRARPDDTAAFDGVDVRQVAQHIAEFVTDEKRGAGRLYALIRCATLTPKPKACQE